MRNPMTRREMLALGAAASIAPFAGLARAQDPAPLPGPAPIPVKELGPVLKTHPVRRTARGFINAANERGVYNEQWVDASVLPRDKQGIWVLDFAFKPLRLQTVETPDKGRRQVHYLYYQVVNHTKEPRMLVPQFTLVTDTGKSYEDTVLPKAVVQIQNREDPTIPLLGAVNIMGVIPPSTKQGVDDAVFGVAIFEGVDPKADRLTLYVRGLSDGYQSIAPPGGGKPVVRYKALRIDMIRRGDEHDLREREITLLDPAYEWVYR